MTLHLAVELILVSGICWLIRWVLGLSLIWVWVWNSQDPISLTELPLRYQQQQDRDLSLSSEGTSSELQGQQYQLKAAPSPAPIAPSPTFCGPMTKFFPSMILPTGATSAITSASPVLVSSFHHPLNHLFYIKSLKITGTISFLFS